MSIQNYIDHALNALPKWFSDRDRPFENIKAFAEIFQRVEDQTLFWKALSFIKTAVGPVTGQPDWLNQHAVDRGTGRQSGESDQALQDRLRSFSDALSIAVLLAAAQQIVDAAGVVGTVTMLELRPNRAFFTDLQPQQGAGGTFSGTPPDMVWSPILIPYQIEQKYDGTDHYALTISGANSPGNDGTFVVDSLVGDGIAYQNASGVAEVDAADWELNRVDADGNILETFRQSYFSRGHRIGTQRASLVVMLPYGCTPAISAAVAEALRLKKGAGVQVLVECRANP